MELGYLQEVKLVIKSLVQSCPVELTVDKLNRDYRDTEGYPIPYGKLGFQSLELFLRFISDTVKVKSSGPMAIVCAVHSEKSEHIQDMIRSQKKTTTRHRFNRAGSKQTPQYSNYAYSTYKPTPMPQQQQQKPYQQRQQRAALITTNRNNLIAPSRSTIVKKYTPPAGEPAKCATIPDSTRQSTTTAVASFQARPTRTDQHTITSHGSGGQRTISDNKQHSVNSQPPIVPKSVVATGYPLSRPVSKSRNPLSRTSKSYMKCAPLPPEVIDSDDMCSVVCDQFQKSATIRAALKDEPKSNQLSAQALQKQVSLPKSNVFELSESNGDQLNDQDEAVPMSAANNIVFRMDFPEHTVVFGKKIDPYKLPADIKPGSVMGIFVSEIHNPYKFWFHIHKENHDLDNLMHHIERFYKTLEPEEFRIRDVCITPGQVCAAQYKNMWHRAEILSPIINGHAKVLFLDYGTVSNVSVEDIKYLPNIFANIPTQAIRGCLSYVKPRGLHWSYEATSYFLSMVSELMLYAQVSEVDEANRAFYMVLCDTNGNEVVQINKTLVEKGFALYDEEWQEFKIKKNGSRWRHLREDFPTFSMVEAGEYPTYFELVDLNHKGIDYERIIDRNIFHPGKLNQLDNLPDAIRNLPFQLLNTNPFRSDIVMQMNQAVLL